MLRYPYDAQLPEEKADDLLFIKDMHLIAEFYEVPHLEATTLSRFFYALERIMSTEVESQFVPLIRSLCEREPDEDYLYEEETKAKDKFIASRLCLFLGHYLTSLLAHTNTAAAGKSILDLMEEFPAFNEYMSINREVKTRKAIG